MSDMSKKLSRDKVRENFIDHVKIMVNYWDKGVLPKMNQTKRLEGLAFSILTAIDGSASLPKFILAPDPHPFDKEYNITNKEDFYPENIGTDVECDISGGLHEHFYKKKP